MAFDPATGHPQQLSPPQADGYPVGVAVGFDRRVVATTSSGQVYSFARLGALLNPPVDVTLKGRNCVARHRSNVAPHQTAEVHPG